MDVVVVVAAADSDYWKRDCHNLPFLAIVVVVPYYWPRRL